MTDTPDPPTLLEWLRRRYPTAKTQTLKRMVQAGRVTVNAVPARALKQSLAPSDRVAVSNRPAGPAPGNARPTAAAAAALDVVYEDADLLVVNKPAGLLTSTVPRERRPTLLALVREYVRGRDPRARVGLIHRLDRDAAGLLVFSKNDRAYESLKAQFFRHDVGREYLALVHGAPSEPAGRIESRLVERTDGTVHTTRERGRGQRAVTEYEVLKTEAGRSLLRVRLHTGRKHQIRVHLAGRGTPIVGDTVYGRPGDTAGRLHLTAVRLTIAHPRSGKSITFDVEPPPEMTQRSRPTA